MIKNRFMIEVSVYSSQVDFADSKRALCRRLDNEHFKIPFESIIDSMRCLFGDNCVIDFKVML